MSPSPLTSSQQEVLRGLPNHVPVPRMDRIWIFSAHQGKIRETGLFVVSLFPEADPEPEREHRTLLTLSYHAGITGGKLDRQETLTEEGRARPAQIERVIAGVTARGGGDPGQPVEGWIGGDQQRWEELLAEVGLVS